jgi:ATP-dependent Clp protease protease subunit
MANTNYVPFVIEKTDKGERSYDIYSRLLKDRIIMLTDEVDNQSMDSIIAQLLFLNNEDSKKPIYFYINSPGGLCTAGLAAVNVMKYIKAPVYTIVLGMAASMGAVLLSCGEKGHRYALPDSTIMTHQSIGGAQGTIQDAIIEMEYWKKLNKRLSMILAKNCGMSLDEYERTVDRNNWMFAEEALKYGIIDEILVSEDDSGITLPDLEQIVSMKGNNEEIEKTSEKFKRFCEALHYDMLPMAGDKE